MSSVDSKPLLEAKGVERHFQLLRNHVPVLRGIDLAIKRGETVSIMGASGAGKSTLLYILGGLDRPSSGQILFDGENIFKWSAARRTEFRAESLGFVFQAYHLLPELDVCENVMLPLMRRMNWVARSGEYRRKALDLLEQVGLGERAHHRPVELSGGEQQRVALARALINDPQVVLADEPTGNLDSRTGDQVLDYLFNLTRAEGRTLVLVTHNEAVAERCTRTILIKDGRVAPDS